jgi:hypothetical protein
MLDESLPWLEVSINNLIPSVGITITKIVEKVP